MIQVEESARMGDQDKPTVFHEGPHSHRGRLLQWCLEPGVSA